VANTVLADLRQLVIKVVELPRPAPWTIYVQPAFTYGEKPPKDLNT